MVFGYRQHQIRLWKIRFLLVLVVVACVFVAWSVVVRWQVEREMAARREAVQAEYDNLSERYDTLKTQVEYLRDERSLEAEVRKNFDVARTGESVVILLDDTQTPPNSSNTAYVATSSAPWWQFWR